MIREDDSELSHKKTPLFWSNREWMGETWGACIRGDWLQRVLIMNPWFLTTIDRLTLREWSTITKHAKNASNFANTSVFLLILSTKAGRSVAENARAGGVFVMGLSSKHQIYRFVKSSIWCSFGLKSCTHHAFLRRHCDFANESTIVD